MRSDGTIADANVQVPDDATIPEGYVEVHQDSFVNSEGYTYNLVTQAFEAVRTRQKISISIREGDRASIIARLNTFDWSDLNDRDLLSMDGILNAFSGGLGG